MNFFPQKLLDAGISPQDAVNLAVLSIHLLSMAVWAGGFAILFLFGKGIAEEEYLHLLRRVLVSTWISLGILAATGVYLTVYQVPTEVPLYSFLRLWGGTRESMAEFAKIPFGLSYGYTLMIKHYAVAASALLTGWMTWNVRHRKRIDILRMFVGLNIALACVILLCAVLMVYLHALSFAHVGGK